jgi:hypothetical protein
MIGYLSTRPRWLSYLPSRPRLHTYNKPKLIGYLHG